MPIDRGVASTFAYPTNSCMAGYGKNSKGIAHELVLNYICNNETWPVILNGKEYVLKIRAAIDALVVFLYPKQAPKMTQPFVQQN